MSYEAVQQNPFLKVLGWISLPFVILFIYLVSVGGNGGGATSTDQADSAPDPATVAAQAAEIEVANKEAAEQAKSALDEATGAYPSAGEDVSPYNERVTEAYHEWVSAEKAYRGADWKSYYIIEHTPHKTDCSQFYGGFIREDATIRGARAACAAQAYLPSPTVPTLDSLLLKRKAVEAPIAETDSTPSAPVSESVPATDVEPKPLTAIIYQPQQ